MCRGAERPPLLLTGIVLAGPTMAPVRGAVLLGEGRVASVLPAGPPAAFDGQVVEFPGCTILPGLIDTHAHLSLPGDGRDVDAFLAEADDDQLVQLFIRNARAAVQGGVTMVRDLGARRDISFRAKAAMEGDPFAPRLSVAGPVITQEGGHGRAFGLEVTDPPSIRAAVRWVVGCGADVVKVMASGGSTQGTARWEATFSIDDLRLIVVEAHRSGVPVVAHVSATEAIARCLEAGVDGLEHANFWSDESLTNGIRSDLVHAMARRRVFVGPTLQTAYRLIQDPAVPAAVKQARWRMLRDASCNARRFWQAGVRIIAGSDAGFLVTRFDELCLGLRLLVDAGIPPIDAIRAATTEAAAALGLRGVLGSIVPGAAADLLVVEGNPLDDISALSRVRAVFRSGTRLRSAEGPQTLEHDQIV